MERIRAAASETRRLVLAFDTRTTLWFAMLGAAIVVTVGTALSAALNVWLDEAFTLHSTGAGPLNAWAQADMFEAQPPFYFVLEAAWRTWNETSIPFARLPSVLFAAAAVAVIVGAARRIAPRTPPLIVVLMTAFNPIVIWAAVEMRVYALVLLVGAVLTWTFFEGFLAWHPSRRARIWYVLFAIIGLYTQYYVGFVLAAHVITLLARRRNRMRAFTGLMAIVGLAFTPFLPVAIMHVRSSGDMVSRVSFLQGARQIANAVFVFILPHDLGSSGAVRFAGLGLAALTILLFVIGRPAIAREPARAVVVQWLVCLAVFSLIFGFSGVPLDVVRHLVVVAPSSLLVAFLFISSLTRLRTLTSSVAVLVFTLFALTQLWSQYRPPLAKQGEWQRVAATLSADNRSTPIAVFPAELAIPLRVYLSLATIPIPKPMPFRLDYIRATTLTGESDVSRVLDPVHARSNRLWMVTSGICGDPKLEHFGYNCPYLEAYLKRRYRVVRSIVFHGALARLYVGTPTHLPIRKRGEKQTDLSLT